MIKMTEGPWVANDKHSDSDYPWRVESDANGCPNDGYILAKLEGPDAKSNARLMASSPALLNIVERLCYALAASGVEPVKDSNDPIESLFHDAAAVRTQIFKCDCCERGDEYNGYGSDGPTIFTCPNHCTCHD